MRQGFDDPLYATIATQRTVGEIEQHGPRRGAALFREAIELFGKALAGLDARDDLRRVAQRLRERRRGLHSKRVPGRSARPRRYSPAESRRAPGRCTSVTCSEPSPQATTKDSGDVRTTIPAGE